MIVDRLSDTFLNLYEKLDLQILAWAIPGTFLAFHLLPWLWDSHGLRAYPGPFIAKFSDIWLGYVSKGAHRSELVHEAHLKYGTLDLGSCIMPPIDIPLYLRPFITGPIVRIAPNHVSIADPDALQVVYAHGNGVVKSDFYDAFVSIRRGLFNVRDRNEHTRKRKIVSHIFSQRNVLDFEPNIRMYVAQLQNQWDRLYDMAVKGMSGNDGEGGWEGRDGRLWLDCLPCELSLRTTASLVC